MAATLGGGVDFADDGTFDATGDYLQRASFGPIRQEISAYDSGGVAGQGTTNFGRRGQQVTLEIMYVDNDVDTVFANMQADNEALAAAVFDATVNGVSLFACKLVDFKSSPKGARSNGLPSPKVYLEATIVLDALRGS